MGERRCIDEALYSQVAVPGAAEAPHSPVDSGATFHSPASPTGTAAAAASQSPPAAAAAAASSPAQFSPPYSPNLSAAAAA